MSEFIKASTYLSVFITLGAYFIGRYINKKTKLAILNPLLIAVILVIVFLLVTGMDYQAYNAGAKYITYLLTPSTVSLGILLYKQFDLLKKNFKAVMAGICAGVITSLCCVLIFSVIFGFTHEEYVTFLPKSITTAIGMVVSEEFGGYASITSVAIVITGILGNVFAVYICRLFRITDPIAVGIGIGSSSHALGTSKAIELGEIQGAMSSLSIVTSGIITVILINLFVLFY